MFTEMSRKAGRANREKSMLLAMMGHEIRTPLHGAIGHLELLERGRLSGEQREHVTMIHRAFDALLALVNNLLDVTKIEANALTIDPAPIYVNRVVEQCVQNFAPAILARHLVLSCHTDPALDRLLEGDDQRLMQVLQNLLSNATKFTQHGSITVSSRLLRHEQGTTWVRLEVADTGIGIPSALQAMVFRPLTQADRSISRRFGGTGLGLFLCRSLAELMGGRMTLQSKPDAGSVFGIEVPLPALEELADVAHYALHGLSVDIIADDPWQRQMLKARLGQWGALIYQHVPAMAGSPDVRIVVANGQTPVKTPTQPAPRYSTIWLTPLGPAVPLWQGNNATVSLFSSDALLAVLLDLGQPKDTGLPLQQPGARQDTAKRLDLLVADDDPVSRALIEDQLHTLGYGTVRVARDGREALNMWLEREPDVVLTDLGMPYLDGVGLLSAIRDRNPGARVIALSAAGPADTSAVAAGGFSRVLRKPALLIDLKRVLVDVHAGACDTPQVSAVRSITHATTFEQVDVALRQAFLENWSGERGSIEKALAHGHRERARRRLHRLEGALLTMGMDALALDCLALQALCTAGEWQQVNVRFNHLLAEIDNATVGKPSTENSRTVADPVVGSGL